MTLSRRIAALATVATVLGVAAAVPASAAAQATEPVRAFSTTTLQFTVQVGPADARRTCTVVGDLRVPAGVTAATPALGAILATNGFGGGKDDTGPNGNGSYAARFAEQGYVTLSYSGLGFGGQQLQHLRRRPRVRRAGRLAAGQFPRGRPRDRQQGWLARRHRRSGAARPSWL